MNRMLRGTAPVNPICRQCGTLETPLWRTGPAGPKTLCNACGVRWKKGKLVLSNCAQGLEPIASSKISPKTASPNAVAAAVTASQQSRVSTITTKGEKGKEATTAPSPRKRSARQAAPTEITTRKRGRSNNLVPLAKTPTTPKPSPATAPVWTSPTDSPLSKPDESPTMDPIPICDDAIAETEPELSMLMNLTIPAASLRSIETSPIEDSPFGTDESSKETLREASSMAAPTSFAVQDATIPPTTAVAGRMSLADVESNMSKDFTELGSKAASGPGSKRAAIPISPATSLISVESPPSTPGFPPEEVNESLKKLRAMAYDPQSSISKVYKDCAFCLGQLCLALPTEKPADYVRAFVHDQSATLNPCGLSHADAQRHGRVLQAYFCDETAYSKALCSYREVYSRPEMLDFCSGAFVQLLVEDVARIVPVLQRKGGRLEDTERLIKWTC